MMDSAWQGMPWQRDQCTRVVVYLKPLAPRFGIAGLVDSMKERPRDGGVWVLIDSKALSEHSDAGGAKASKQTHAVELRQRAAVAKHDGADVLRPREIKESRWHKLPVELVLIDLDGLNVQAPLRVRLRSTLCIA
jgi:hypothetical protein